MWNSNPQQFETLKYPANSVYHPLRTTYIHSDWLLSERGFERFNELGEHQRGESSEHCEVDL